MKEYVKEPITEADIGRAIRLRYNAGNPNNRTVHVRGIVDDRVVVRWWRGPARGWTYELWSHERVIASAGFLTWVKRKRTLKALR